MSPAAADECPMTEECPGYDRERRTCLLRPGDCEFAPAVGEPDTVAVFDSLGDAPPAGAAGAGS